MADPSPNATVLHREDPCERLTIVRVAPSGWDLPAFTPGQYATLGLPDPADGGRLLKRVYSIASAPGSGYLEFLVERVREGEFTTELWPLQTGDALWLGETVAGGFTLDAVPAGRDLALIGTGTGLAPYLSMLRAYRGSSRWNRCAIVHGARSAAELAYRDELTAAAADDPGLSYVPTLTREPQDSGWSGARGRVQALLEDGAWERAVGAPLDPATWHVFLCGSPAMVDDMEARLAQRGFSAHTADQPGNIHFERYW